MVEEKERPNPPIKLQTFEELALRYPGLDPQAMHAYVVMRKAQTRIEVALETHLARNQLSFGRYLVLVHLIRAEGYSLAPAQLAEHCGITRASITGLVDTLEKSGHVERENDPDDRRSVQVRLTLAGLVALLRYAPAAGVASLFFPAPASHGAGYAVVEWGGAGSAADSHGASVGVPQPPRMAVSLEIALVPRVSSAMQSAYLGPARDSELFLPPTAVR